MLRALVASFVLSLGLGCAAPVEPVNEELAPPERPLRPLPVAIDRCGGEPVAQLARPGSVRDLAVADARLAWIAEANTGTPGVHVLDLAARKIELHNDAALHLAVNGADLAWSTSSRIAFGTSAMTTEGDVRALALDPTHLTYVERFTPTVARLIRRERSSLEASALAEGALADVVAVDGSNAWYAVTATNDSAVSTVFRRVSLAGGAFSEYEALPGTAIKMSASSLRATALLRTGGSLLVDMSPNDEHARTIYQSSDIRDFAVRASDVYFTEGTSVLRFRGDGATIERVFTGTCAVSAIAASPDAIYYVASNSVGGAIYRLP
jgi:hypothetical protein